jgi:GNAT superfamily N-acetyltransferase
MPDLDRLEQLKSCDEPAFRELYEIYAASIVARERKPQEWICKMVRSPEYRVWVMKSAGRVTGFSIVFLPSAGHFALLEYMAVAAERRNSGVGSELFQQSMRAVLSEGRSLPVLLEIDSDREAGDDQQIRTRRQRFYRRLGCVQVSGLQYILPLPGLDAPPPPAGSEERAGTVAQYDLSGRLSRFTARSADRPDVARAARSRSARVRVRGERS